MQAATAQPSDFDSTINTWLIGHLTEEQKFSLEKYRQQLIPEIAAKAHEIFKEICDAVKEDNAKQMSTHIVDSKVHDLPQSLVSIFEERLTNKHQMIFKGSYAQANGKNCPGDRNNSVGKQFLAQLKAEEIWKVSFSVTWAVTNLASFIPEVVYPIPEDVECKFSVTQILWEARATANDYDLVKLVTAPGAPSEKAHQVLLKTLPYFSKLLEGKAATREIKFEGLTLAGVQKALQYLYHGGLDEMTNLTEIRAIQKVASHWEFKPLQEWCLKSLKKWVESNPITAENFHTHLDLALADENTTYKISVLRFLNESQKWELIINLSDNDLKNCIKIAKQQKFSHLQAHLQDIFYTRQEAKATSTPAT